jgi:hypothetical protein
MAILRFEVIKITRDWDGSSCEVESKLISVHKDMFPNDIFQQISMINLQIGQEFQETNKIMRK